MEDRQHLDLFLVWIYHVDDPVIPVNDLADGFAFDLALLLPLRLLRLTTTLQTGLHLVERYRLAFSRLLQSDVDFVQEDEAFDSIFERGIVRKLFDGSDDPCFGGRWRHSWLRSLCVLRHSNYVEG